MVYGDFFEVARRLSLSVYIKVDVSCVKFGGRCMNGVLRLNDQLCLDPFWCFGVWD